MNQTCDHEFYMANDQKIYVDVNEDRLKDGQLIPLSFVWENGVRYDIDKVIDIRPAASMKAGGTGIRYTIRAKNRETYMYLEEERGVSKWFMERKGSVAIKKDEVSRNKKTGRT